MSSRKLNSRPITDFFTPIKKTVANRQEHAATNVTTASTSSPSPSSLVTNPLYSRTEPSSRVVNSTANMGNRTMGPNKAATKQQVASNDDILEELLQTHAPQIGQSIGEKFWIKKNQNVVAHPAKGTPSNNPSIVFPSGYLVFDSLCHGGLRERFNDRVRQDTCHNTTKAVRYAQFALKKFKVRKQGRDWYTVSCGGYNLVYIERKESKKPIPSNTSAIIVPVELHSKQRVKISHWTRARECVVCLAKAKEQYPHLNRDEMRKQKLINQSGAGCPDCKKGEGAAVCKHCWNQFDHQQFLMM
ncbi:hypothetical protein IV203_006106 [Nitzschia inconspicua]|uniref:Uncharacterized protein n=1 Tax=Nitzschia inconspicua TaxID=303405 RepID=A0A9K3PGQ4_9STRA|nr:hypothetical protein IV203_006106 [Nitzschia inconspicua]